MKQSKGTTGLSSVSFDSSAMQPEVFLCLLIEHNPRQFFYYDMHNTILLLWLVSRQLNCITKFVSCYAFYNIYNLVKN